MNQKLEKNNQNRVILQKVKKTDYYLNYLA